MKKYIVFWYCFCKVFILFYLFSNLWLLFFFYAFYPIFIDKNFYSDYLFTVFAVV